MLFYPTRHQGQRKAEIQPQLMERMLLYPEFQTLKGPFPAGSPFVLEVQPCFAHTREDNPDTLFNKFNGPDY